MTQKQYARLKYHAFPSLFRLEMVVGAKINSEKMTQWSDSSCHSSFLLCLYEELYVKIGKRLKLDIPIIDCNLIRLHHCIDQLVTQYYHQQQQQKIIFNMNELPLALEFYLQFDGRFFFH